MDYASGTPIDKKVLKKMTPYFSEQFFNAGSIYQEGFDVRDILQNARIKISKFLCVRPQEIIFTDGGTEANNLVLRGLVSRWKKDNKGGIPHIITSEIEHASILETCKDLESKNLAEITYISVDGQGSLNLKELKESFKDNTILVSISYVNGEIGVIQDIRTIAKTIRHYRKHHKTHLPYFHTDAVQAVNYLDINVQKLGVDFMTINGSKIYGPKKIAALYKKTNIKIDSIITGGSQEFGLRSGTENIPYIVGFSEAILLLTVSMQELEFERLQVLQNFFQELLVKKMTINFVINGMHSERIPNIINISIPDLSSEEIVLRLDAVGVKTSVKSACKSGEEGDSHVIRALRDTNTQSIRFSFGRDTTKKDVEYVVQQLVFISDKMQQVFTTYVKK